MTKDLNILDVEEVEEKEITIEERFENLTEEEQQEVLDNYEFEHYKSWAYYVGLVFGFLGIHRYYLGDTKYAIGMTLTLGGLGVWWIADMFLSSFRIKDKNKFIYVDNIQRIEKRNREQAEREELERVLAEM